MNHSWYPFELSRLSGCLDYQIGGASCPCTASLCCTDLKHEMCWSDAKGTCLDFHASRFGQLRRACGVDAGFEFWRVHLISNGECTIFSKWLCTSCSLNTQPVIEVCPALLMQWSFIFLLFCFFLSSWFINAVALWGEGMHGCVSM